VGFQLDQSLERSSVINDIRFALSSRPVILILALSALFRIVFHFYVLPNSPSGFGPDEATYAALAKHVSEGLPVEEFPAYGAGLYNSAKSIILPSAFLVQLGMAELSAVRAIASICGLASSLLLVLCFLSLLKLRSQTFNKLSPIRDRKFLVLLLIFTFFPSNFVWSTIGLRESGSQFWLITTFYLILKLLDSTGKDSWKFTALSSIALTLAYGARPQTALVFSLVALLTSIVLLLKFRKFLPVVAILIGVLGGNAFITTPQVEIKQRLGAINIAKPDKSASAKCKKQNDVIQYEGKEFLCTTYNTHQVVERNPTLFAINIAKPDKSASAKCKKQNDVIQYEGKEFLCTTYNTYQVVERNPLQAVAGTVLTIQILEHKRKVNALDAESALPANDCQGLSRDILRLIECNIGELHYYLFAFLFRPLVFFDQGSTTLTYAALENLGWMILIPISIWVSLRKGENAVDRFINLSLTSYVIVFASTAALYEGNLGTAFRHKSTILWPLIFILMIAQEILPKLERKTNSVS